MWMTDLTAGFGAGNPGFLRAHCDMSDSPWMQHRLVAGVGWGGAAAPLGLYSVPGLSEGCSRARLCGTARLKFRPRFYPQRHDARHSWNYERTHQMRDSGGTAGLNPTGDDGGIFTRRAPDAETFYSHRLNDHISMDNFYKEPRDATRRERTRLLKMFRKACRSFGEWLTGESCLVLPDL